MNNSHNRISSIISKVALIGSWKFDVTHNTLWWSDVTYQIHNVPVGEVLDVENALDFYYWEDRPKVEKSFKAAITDKTQFDVTLQLVTRTGVLKWVRSIGYPVLDDAQNVVMIEGIFQDIDEQMSASLKLDKYKSSLESLNNIMTTKDFTNSSLALDEALKLAVNYLGFDRGVIGSFESDDYCIWHCYSPKPELRIAVGKKLVLAETYCSLIQKNEKSLFVSSIEDSELNNYEFSSRLKYEAFIGIPIYIKNKLFGTLCFSAEKKKENEITSLEMNFTKMFASWVETIIERNALFQDLQNAIQVEKEDKEQLRIAHQEVEYERAMAVQNSKMATLGQMAGGVAHEINNPLTIVQGFARSLIRKLSKDPAEIDDKEQTVDYLNKIDNAADRISKIVKGLKNFARDGAGDDFKQSLVNDIIKETLSFCEEKFKNNGVGLYLNLPGNDLSISCNSTQISQVILNLLHNSYDALIDNTHPDPWIQINVRKIISEENSKIVIQVKDAGSGIKESVIESLMTPFFTTKAVGKGTGLGLSISKGIVESHGGSLFYELDDGFTSFVIELPLKIAATKIENSENKIAS